jgi:hypothetical protein
MYTGKRRELRDPSVIVMNLCIDIVQWKTEKTFRAGHEYSVSIGHYQCILVG